VNRTGTPVALVSAALLWAGAAPLAAWQHAADDSATAAARRFLDAAEKDLAIRSVGLNRAGWISENFITHDTELLAAAAQAEVALALKRLVDQARPFDGVALPAALRRRLLLLKLQLAAPAPPDSVDALEMTLLGAGLDADYGRARYCAPTPRGAASCRNLDDLEHVLAQSRNPDSLLDAWRGWHATAVPTRDRYARFVALANAGARAAGFADAGAMWRAGYDMPPDSFGSGSWPAMARRSCRRGGCCRSICSATSGARTGAPLPTWSCRRRPRKAGAGPI
jgi:peptidyl-dipeptidase A